MDFKDEGGTIHNLFLPPRSLLILEDEGRHEWMHSIPRRKYDKFNGEVRSRRQRVTLTFRRLRNPPCTCQWPRMCDSQNKEIAV